MTMASWSSSSRPVTTWRCRSGSTTSRVETKVERGLATGVAPGVAATCAVGLAAGPSELTVAPVKVDRYDFKFGQAASTRLARSPRVTCVVAAVPAAAVPAADRRADARGRCLRLGWRRFLTTGRKAQTDDDQQHNATSYPHFTYLVPERHCYKVNVHVADKPSRVSEVEDLLREQRVERRPQHRERHVRRSSRHQFVCGDSRQRAGQGQDFIAQSISFERRRLSGFGG